MPVHIVVGGQYGSEGKGKTAHYFAEQFKARAAVKTSGTNSGHTVYDSEGEKHILRVLPSPCVNHDVSCVIPAGAVFSTDLLFQELQELHFPAENVFIHPNAGIITHTMENHEKWSTHLMDIGSTTSGTGAATVNRAQRNGEFVRACEVSCLDNFLVDTSTLMRKWLNRGEHLIIEGGQGFGLSYYHTPCYPRCTSRDTTAAAFLSEAGLGISDVENVIQVLRSYEIRVAGNSGYMAHETTWEQVTKDARSDVPICERTSVSNHVRRVGYFDPTLVKRAVCINQPTITVMNFMDYIGEDDGVPTDMLGPKRLEFIRSVEVETQCRITHVGFSGKDIRPVKDATIREG